MTCHRSLGVCAYLLLYGCVAPEAIPYRQCGVIRRFATLMELFFCIPQYNALIQLLFCRFCFVFQWTVLLFVVGVFSFDTKCRLASLVLFEG